MAKVILLDVNLLVYAFSSSVPENENAEAWLNEQLRTGVQIAVPWKSAMDFVRLVSNDRIFPSGPSVADAWRQIDTLLSEPNVWIPLPTAQHHLVVSEIVASRAFSSNDMPDIHLAALAISHGLKLATHDKGFARFDGLRWFDPLAA